jgi:hypothetical protein
LRRSLFGWKQDVPVKYSRLEPTLDESPKAWEGVQLRQQGFLVDTIKALRNVGIQHVLGALLDAFEDGHDRIVAGAAWSKPVAIGLESGFPFGFQCELDQSLTCAIRQRGNAEGPLFIGSGFWDPDPTDGLWLGIQVEGGNQVEPLFGFNGSNAIDSGSVLALIVLGHSADG